MAVIERHLSEVSLDWGQINLIEDNEHQLVKHSQIVITNSNIYVLYFMKKNVLTNFTLPSH